MSSKRSRSTFEADSKHAPYALFGTPLPDEADSRDDGAYLPLWKQDVRDEKGRRRLHGAFTGGWSAGYFNTVGSKEGWAPSTFVSSRSSRNKDGAAPKQQRAEDYMDDEDLEDASQAQQLQTSQAFAGLGSSKDDQASAKGLMGLLRADGDTMGLKLLRRMGWKDGQGIGPKVRRTARLDVGNPPAGAQVETHLFAPDNSAMIRFVRKTDRRGLGHTAEVKLQRLHGEKHAAGTDDVDDAFGRLNGPSPLSTATSKSKPPRAAFGVGVLNDTGSDEEDAYEIGPRIKYNRVIGGDKARKVKKTTAVANPTLSTTLKFVSRTARAASGVGRCHDGRLPLPGFTLAKVTEDLSALFLQYAPPPVPPGWRSAKDAAAATTGGAAGEYVSTADAAKASSLDPRARAALLGEKALPGKSVFDFLSSSARDKLALASGKSNLPPARGETPAERAVSEEERRKALWDRVPKLDRDTAAAALSRISTGPYSDDELKGARYRKYLENQSNPGLPAADKAKGMTDEDFVREMNEFYNCARIFKPMTGFMASRFTSSKAMLNPSRGADGTASELLSKPEAKKTDPAEEAAKMGMFGHLTRSVDDFLPTRLLCKRFNVRPPANSRSDEREENPPRASASWPVPPRTEMPPGGLTTTAAPLSLPALEMTGGSPERKAPVALHPSAAEVNPEKNEAVEGRAANEDVLRAIFGDSDSE
ncbi:hypothetical protein RJ55_00750 [Drechmeria coniospora]|nr:hypothetical protein RJ55_00750 [Drechmeria coniospora]